MNYKVFSDFQRGYAHVEDGTSCEDYAVSFCDPDGKYYIGAVCDGHSDRNCFRSAKGAQYGCEAAVEILSRFLDLYHEAHETYHEVGQAAQERLKRSIKQCWDNKVFADLREHPVMPEELEPLSERVREIYESGQALQSIYGATFLAFAVSETLFIALHIGDGIMISVDGDGIYAEPLPHDPKSEMGSPASLCDTDLFRREYAFRSMVSDQLPLAVFVSSDGIGDSMDNMQFRKLLRSLVEKFVSMEDEETRPECLNGRQKNYLQSCLAYWAGKGNGEQDDCSLAGIYDPTCEMPEVKIPLEEAEKLLEDILEQQEAVRRDYAERKENIIKKLEEMTEKTGRSFRGHADGENRTGSEGKMEELKQVLRIMEKNEQRKLQSFSARVEEYKEYVRRARRDVLVDKESVALEGDILKDKESVTVDEDVFAGAMEMGIDVGKKVTESFGDDKENVIENGGDDKEKAGWNDERA